MGTDRGVRGLRRKNGEECNLAALQERCLIMPRSPGMVMKNAWEFNGFFKKRETASGHLEASESIS